jgi:hypothetical protein
MIDERWFGKDFEVSCRGLNKVLFRNFPGGTEENYEKPQSGYPQSRTSFEPSMPTRSVHAHIARKNGI